VRPVSEGGGVVASLKAWWPFSLRVYSFGLGTLLVGVMEGGRQPFRLRDSLNFDRHIISEKE